MIALDPAVARWCAKPIDLGRGLSVLRPVVIGTDAVPAITDVEQARPLPELAVFSVVCRGHDPGAEEIALAALVAVRDLDNPRSALYADIVDPFLGEAARHALETLVDLRNYTFKGEFARKYVAMGKDEGRVERSREVLAKQLRQRFGELPEDVKQRIEAAELDELDRWLDRVIVADSLADVFDAAR